jgi:hypothetical protein
MTTSLVGFFLDKPLANAAIVQLEVAGYTGHLQEGVRYDSKWQEGRIAVVVAAPDHEEASVRALLLRSGALDVQGDASSDNGSTATNMTRGDTAIPLGTRGTAPAFDNTDAAGHTNPRPLSPAEGMRGRTGEGVAAMFDDEPTTNPVNHQISQGATVYDLAGDKVGSVAGYDLQAGYLDVRKGWLFHKDIFVPIDGIDSTDAESIYLRLSKDELNGPRYEAPPIPAFGEKEPFTNRIPRVDEPSWADRDAGRPLSDQKQ